VNRLQSVISMLLLLAAGMLVPGMVAADGARTPDSNNTPDEAVPVQSGVPVSDSVNQNDDPTDWYRIYALAGQTLTVNVSFGTSNCDLRVNAYTFYLSTIFGNIGEAQGGGNPRGDTGLCSVNGTYYIRIRSSGGSTTYTANVTVGTPPTLTPGVISAGSLDWNAHRADYYRIWLNGNQGGQAEAVWINAQKSPQNQGLGKRFYDILNFNGSHEFNGSGSSSTRMNITAAATHSGWYYHRLYTYQSAVSYTLECGKYTVPCDSDSDYLNATPVNPKSSQQGVVDKGFDHYDWYRCPVTAGTNMIVNVSQINVRYIFNVSVFDSKLNYIAGDDSYPPQNQWPYRYREIITPSAPVDDYYFVVVMAVSNNQNDDNVQIPYWINFTTPNRPPRIKAQFSPVTVDEDVQNKVNVADHFSDPDGDSLAVKVSAPHIQGSYCQTTGELSIFGAPNWYGNENAQVIAQDSQFQTVAIVNVTVLPVEDSPHLMKPLPDIVMDQARSYGPVDLNQHFFDNDTLYPPGDKLAFGVYANGSLWVDINAAGKVTFSAPVNFWGTVNLTFTATDLAGNIANGPCKVTVRHVNQAPLVRTQPPEQVVNEDESLLVDFSQYFWDPDGDPITLIVSQNMSIQVLTKAGDLNVTFRPEPDTSGYYENIKLTARDSSGTGENYVVVKVTVVAANDPPRITAFSPPGGVTLKEGDGMDFSVAATDPESASAINYTWYLDGVQVLAHATTYPYRSDFASAGEHVVKVSVDDGELATTMEWRLTVENVNRDPTKLTIVSPRPGETFKEGAAIRFEANATDPDGDELSYRWMEGLMEFGSGRSTLARLGVGIHKISLEVSDGNATIKSGVVSIEVKANSRPSIIAFSPPDGKRVEKGKTIMFSAEAIDADNDALSYCWTEGGKVIGTGQSFSLSTLSVGKHRITVTVSDGLVTAENTVTIEVTAPAEKGTDPMMLAVIAVAIGAAAAVAGLVMMMRGKKREAAPAVRQQPELKW